MTIVDGGERLVRCLNALVQQDAAPELDIIVPYDNTVTAMDDVERRFPAVRFLPLGELTTTHAPGTP
ncbi:MAG TPA: hypothetical protein VF021_10465, partial [Longimicrobiales bacterium]